MKRNRVTSSETPFLTGATHRRTVPPPVWRKLLSGILLSLPLIRHLSSPFNGTNWNDNSKHSKRSFHHLLPQDQFQLLLFNSRVTAFAPPVVKASQENIQSALNFLKKNSLSGGTDLKKAIRTALEQKSPDSALTERIVLFSDGNSTLGTLDSHKISTWFQSANAGPASTPRMKLYAYGIGNDCNKILLRELATGSGGIFEYVGENEATEFKLDNFVTHLTMNPVSNLHLQMSSAENFHHVYRYPDKPVFEQGMAHWVGQYDSPARQVSFTVTANRSGSPTTLNRTADLPVHSSEHIFIPRNWAKARVDFLLHKIEMEGEDADSIWESSSSPDGTNLSPPTLRSWRRHALYYGLV